MSGPQPWTLGWVDPIHSLPTLLLMAVAAYRVSAMREAGASRSLWLALVGLVGGSAVNIAPLNAWLLQVGGATGQAVAVEFFTVMAAGFVLRLVAQATETREGGLLPTTLTAMASAAALVMMSVPLLVIRPADPAALSAAGQVPAAEEALAWSAHWVSVLGLLTWALLAAITLCRHYSRAAEVGPLRTRLHLIGIGCASGLGFVTARVAGIACAITGYGPQWQAHGLDIQNAFLAISLLLIGCGAGYPQLVMGMATVSTEVATARSLIRLRRLWRLMVTAAPGVTLTSSPVLWMLAGPVSQRERLYRRVMEIRDGLLALSPYVSADLRAEVTASAVARGSSPSEAEVVAEAVCITAALRAKQAGHSVITDDDASADVALPVFDDQGDPAKVMGTLGEEVAWLELLAEAHAKWPLTRHLEAEHLDAAGERVV